MSQELGVAERDPHFTNPYSRRASKQASGGSAGGMQASGSKVKKKKSFKKGPQLSRQFGDLWLLDVQVIAIFFTCNNP